MVFTRGRTSAKRLQIEWDVPTYTVEKSTAPTAVSHVLSRDAALSFVRGEDKRPLLVMRECQECVGTDFALLRRSTNNERTMLLTRWFHCVKLPSTVTRKDHPLHNLFSQKAPPHLFFTTRDGKETVTLAGNLAPSQVWKRMIKVLRLSYKRNPSRAVKSLLNTMNKFDTLDEKELQARRQLDRTLEKSGPKSSRFKKLKTALDGILKERKALLAKEKRILDLGLKL